MVMTSDSSQSESSRPWTATFTSRSQSFTVPPKDEPKSPLHHRAPQSSHSLENEAHSSHHGTLVPSSNGDKKPQTLGEAIKSMNPKDLLQVHKQPCGRDGLMWGIGNGALVGALAVVFGASISRAGNWAVGGFAIGSLISYEWCQRQLHAEHARIQGMVAKFKAEAHLRKQQEEREKKRVEETQRIIREEREREEQRRAGAWWKFW